MRDRDDLPTISEYVSVKDAAKILKTTDKMVYAYIDQGRIKAVKLSNFIVIPKDELESFRRKASGRPRMLVPKWRISSKDNAFLATSIRVNVYAGKYDILQEKLEQIRANGEHMFPGTVARYIMGPEQLFDKIEILLIWKQGIMPSADERERIVEDFRTAMSDVLDWSSAQYSQNKVYMHT